METDDSEREGSESIHESRAATRADRFARREGKPLRRLQRLLQDVFPLLLLAGVATGAFITFYNKEKVHRPGDDAPLAVGFVIVVLILAYLNPEVQRWVRIRGKGHLKE